MHNKFNEEERYLKAKKRVEDIKSFYVHLTLYCVCVPILTVINLIFVPHYHWFWFSALGWGLGIFFHWLGVFGFRKIGFTKNWEEKKIQELMNNDKN